MLNYRSVQGHCKLTFKVNHSRTLQCLGLSDCSLSGCWQQSRTCSCQQQLVIWCWIMSGSIRQGELRGDVGWTVQIITLHSLFLFHSRLDSFPVNVLNSSMTKSLSPWPIRCQNQVCKSAVFDAMNWTGVLFVCSMFSTSFTCVMSVGHPLHILMPLSVCPSPTQCPSLGSSHCWMSFTCSTDLYQCPSPAWLEGFKPVRISRYFEQSVMRDSMKHPNFGWPRECCMSGFFIQNIDEQECLCWSDGIDHLGTGSFCLRINRGSWMYQNWNAGCLCSGYVAPSASSCLLDSSVW